MPNVSEELLPADTAALLGGSGREGLAVLGLTESADPQTIVEAIDAFVDAWQLGDRPEKEVLDPAVAQYAMGSLWGEQLVRQFKWEWRFVTFHEHADTRAAGVLSPDRSLVVYPIHFLMGCLRDPKVDCTVALAFNMLVADGGVAGNLGPKAGDYFNLMDGVRRIVPKG